MANKVKFLTGSINNLPSTKHAGQVYFVLNNDGTGSIFYDKDDSTRLLMDSNNTKILVGTCDTESDDRLKTIFLNENTKWEEGKKTLLYVLFKHTNTAQNPEFSVYNKNGEAAYLGFKNVVSGGRNISDTDLNKAGLEDTLLQYLYNGSGFNYVSGINDAQGKPFYGVSQKSFKTANQPILPFNLAGENINGELVPAAFSPFLVGGPLYVSESHLEPKLTGSGKNLFDKHSELLLKLGEDEINLTPYKPLFLKGKLEGSIFTPDKNAPFVSDTENGFDYIYIGEITDATTESGNNSYINFNTAHQLYTHSDGVLHSYTSMAARVGHDLIIGDLHYNGSEEVTIDTYDETSYIFVGSE